MKSYIVIIYDTTLKLKKPPSPLRLAPFSFFNLRCFLVSLERGGLQNGLPASSPKMKIIYSGKQKKRGLNDTCSFASIWGFAKNKAYSSPFSLPYVISKLHFKLILQSKAPAHFKWAFSEMTSVAMVSADIQEFSNQENSKIKPDI